MVTLRLIRHAESRWNAERRWQGQSDPGLSARGQEQAHSLAGRLKAAPPQRIVSSDLRRARETAEILGETLGLAVDCDVRLRERSLGAWSGLFAHQVEARWPAEVAALRVGDPHFRPPGGESLFEVRERFGAFLADWYARLAETSAVIVTHGGLVRALFPGTRLPNTGVQAAALESLWQTVGAGCESPPRRA